jgi:hypothetical protein
MTGVLGETRLLLRHLMFGALRLAKLEVIVSYLGCRRLMTMKHYSRYWKRFVKRSTRDARLRVANATKTITQKQVESSRSCTSVLEPRLRMIQRGEGMLIGFVKLAICAEEPGYSAYRAQGAARGLASVSVGGCFDYSTSTVYNLNSSFVALTHGCYGRATRGQAQISYNGIRQPAVFCHR